MIGLENRRGLTRIGVARPGVEEEWARPTRGSRAGSKRNWGPRRGYHHQIRRAVSEVGGERRGVGDGMSHLPRHPIRTPPIISLLFASCSFLSNPPLPLAVRTPFLLLFFFCPFLSFFSWKKNPGIRFSLYGCSKMSQLTFFSSIKLQLNAQ